MVPDYIAFCSYTRKAAREGMERVLKKFKGTFREDSFTLFKTIHSLCLARTRDAGIEVIDENKHIPAFSYLERGETVKLETGKDEGRPVGIFYETRTGKLSFYLANIILYRITSSTFRKQRFLKNSFSKRSTLKKHLINVPTRGYRRNCLMAVFFIISFSTSWHRLNISIRSSFLKLDVSKTGIGFSSEMLLRYSSGGITKR